MDKHWSMGKRFIICALAFVALTLVVLAPFVIIHIKSLHKTPGVPVLCVLGKKQDLSWADVPASTFRRPPWDRWKLDDIGDGRAKNRVISWENGNRTETVVAGPEGATTSFRQDLFDLVVPDRLGWAGHIHWEMSVWGEVSQDASEYHISFRACLKSQLYAAAREK